MVVDTKLPLRIIVQCGISNRSLESDEGSTIPTTSRKRRSARRRVRFTDSSVSNVNAKVALIPTRGELNSEDIYYSRQELRKMWNRAKKNADRVNASQTTIVKSIDKVFESATAPQPSQESFQGLSSLYDSSARGLERLISEHMTEQRKAAVKRILEVQASTKDSEKRTSLMRMRSMLVSRKARLFAERLAFADEEAARQ